MPETDTVEPPAVVPRNEFLKTMNEVERRADVLSEAGKALMELTHAVSTVGGKGEVTIKIKMSRREAGQVLIEPSVTSKVPKSKPLACALYVNEAGCLQANDPAQQEFPSIVSMAEHQRRVNKV